MLYCLGAWIVSFLAGIFATGMVAGATSKMGASAVGSWMLFAIALQVLFALIITVFLFGQLKQSRSVGHLALLMIVYAVGQVGLLGCTVFGTFVLFNR